MVEEANREDRAVAQSGTRWREQFPEQGMRAVEVFGIFSCYFLLCTLQNVAVECVFFHSLHVKTASISSRRGRAQRSSLFELLGRDGGAPRVTAFSNYPRSIDKRGVERDGCDPIARSLRAKRERRGRHRAAKEFPRAGSKR